MANITLLPSAKVPLIYDGELTMTTEWYRFFWNIYGFTGTGIVPVDKGGTGLDTIGEHQLIIGTANNVFEPVLLSSASIAITYPAGFINLEIGASGVTPGTYGSASQVGQFTVNQYGSLTFAGNVNIGIDASQIISGTLPVVRGGTGQSSYTNGQLLIGNTTGNTLTKATLTAGTGISITNGAGSITIGNTGVLGVTGTSPVASSGGQNPVISMPAATTSVSGYLTSTDWNTFNNKQPAGSYLTAVSVVSANGFAGTSSGGTTPALTLSTTITGLLKGNGTAISAATSGTDYAPATSGTSILYGNGAGGFSNVTIGTGVSFVGGTLSATGSGGTVTSVTGTSPVVSSGGTTPAISLATAYGDTLNPYASKTANYFLAAPNGVAGVPTFRAIVAADIPALSYVTSVGGTGSVNGITLTGTVTSSGNLTLGGTLSGIGNSQLTNSTISGVALGGNLFSLTAGTGVSFSSGTTYNGSAAITINATGTGGTVTSVAALTLGTTGTDLSSTVANSTTTPVITLNVPTASATNRGALSSTDWSTFNGKQAALVSGTNIKTVGGVSLLGSGDVGTIGTGYGGTGLTSFTANGVVYASSTSALTTNSAFTYDGTSLVHSISGLYPLIAVRSSGTNAILGYQINNTGTGGIDWRIEEGRSAVGEFNITNISASAAIPFKINAAGTASTFSTSVIGVQFIPTGSSAPSNGLYLPTTNSVGIATNSTYRFRIDAVGNSGLGVTPAPWDTFVAAEISGGAFAGIPGNQTILTNNAYYATSNFRYITTAAAAVYQQAGSAHTWYAAASGSANAAISTTQVLAVSLNNSLALQGATVKAGTGITFPAAQSASTDVNTLDDYEEGTWTPVLTFNSANTGMTGTFSGSYTKIGNQVTLFCRIALTNVGSSTGNATITGLPFAAGTNYPAAIIDPSAGMNGLTAGGAIFTILSGSTIYIGIQTTTARTVLTNVNFTSSADIRFITTYFV